jgi:hypothetical protein
VSFNFGVNVFEVFTEGWQWYHKYPKGSPLKSDWVLLMKGDPDPATVILPLDWISCESTASGCSCVSSAWVKKCAGGRAHTK